jgi:hypothetical protein
MFEQERQCVPDGLAVHALHRDSCRSSDRRSPRRKGYDAHCGGDRSGRLPVAHRQSGRKRASPLGVNEKSRSPEALPGIPQVREVLLAHRVGAIKGKTAGQRLARFVLGRQEVRGSIPLRSTHEPVVSTWVLAKSASVSVMPSWPRNRGPGVGADHQSHVAPTRPVVDDGSRRVVDDRCREGAKGGSNARGIPVSVATG